MPFTRSYSMLRKSLSQFTRRYNSTFSTLLTALGVGSAIIYYHDHQWEIMRVNGPSMYPFLNSEYHTSMQKTKVLVDKKRAYITKNLKRGMVIAFWSPSTPERMIIKRIVALPGDEVTTRPPYPFRREQVPYGYVWVEGENPDGSKSRDSNDYGPISVNLIVGEAKAIVWPWSQRTWVRWQDFRPTHDRVLQDKYPVKVPEMYS